MYDEKRGDLVFWNRKSNERRQLEKEKRRQTYERVLQLHKRASFLFYIDEVILESYVGKDCVKLVGNVATGSATVGEQFELYSCNGMKKADVHAEEFYVGADRVDALVAEEKTVAVYPIQNDIPYKAGDILCKLLITEEQK